MTWIALRTLVGDDSEYFAVNFGVSFGCFLIAEQIAIFCGVMLLSTISQIRDAPKADTWVMCGGARYANDIRASSDDAALAIKGGWRLLVSYVAGAAELFAESS